MALKTIEIPKLDAAVVDAQLFAQYDRTQSKDRIRVITTSIRAEDKRLRAKHAWLAYQNTIGMAVFVVCLGAMAATSWAWHVGALRWWAVIPLNAFFASILHELEHDLIHEMYFFGYKWLQAAMFFTIMLAKLGANPWWRRQVHMKHHRESGQKTDIEERLIGLGLRPAQLWQRVLVAVTPVACAMPSFNPAILRDEPEFNVNYMIMVNNMVHVAFFLWSFLLLYPFILPDAMKPFVDYAAVLLLLPNALRNVSLQLISSYSHYYGDIPAGDPFYQNQILNHWLLWPLQLFCCNFGQTHILHHYVTNQPFYLRQMTYFGVRDTMIAQGVRVNDFGTFWRSNRYHPALAGTAAARAKAA